jgi:hypothetical protein
MTLRKEGMKNWVEPKFPFEEEGKPERSEGGEVIELKHFLIRRIVSV